MILEDDVIRRIAAATPGPLTGFGIGDDAALVDGQLITVDTMVEGVHFDHRLTPGDVGYKLVAVNVSDIGAMGGTPTWAVLALTLPEPLDLVWVDEFAVGLGEGLRTFGVVLVGGDTTRGPGRVLTLTVGGTVAQPVRRDGARPGDTLWVTGTLGRAAEAFFTNEPTALLHFRRPKPPLRFGQAIAELATAMLDLSDGLSRDLPRLCLASGCCGVVDAASLPTPTRWSMAFGEDYELLFTTPSGVDERVAEIARTANVRVSKIGRIEAGHGARLSDGSPWPAPSFSHFGAP